MDVRDVSLTAVSASLYAVLSVVLAPVSFGPIQLRVADCLLPLAALFGWPLIFGLTIGCFIGNLAGGVIAFGMVNPLDITFGPIANLVATVLIFNFRKKRLLACVLGAFAVGIIVGGYLWTFVPSPEIFELALPAWLAMVISITASSLIAVAIMGYALLSILSRPKILEAFKSKGLKVHE